MASGTISAPSSGVNRVSDKPYGLLKISAAAAWTGLSPQTLRNAVRAGGLRCYVTLGSHRLFSLVDLKRYLGRPEEEEKQNRQVVVYARVSSQGQAKGLAKNEESSLTRQLDDLLQYARVNFGECNPVVFRDVASGITFGDSRPGFARLMNRICAGDFNGGTLLISYFERLARIGYELCEQICRSHDIEIVVINEKEDKSIEEEGILDLLAFAHVISCRTYARRGVDKLRIKVSNEQIKRILELSALGNSRQVIVSTLEREKLGVDPIEGRKLTKTVISRVLKDHCKVRQHIVGSARGTTFTQFVQEHVRVNGAAEAKNTKIQHKVLKAHYDAYCAKNGLAPISNRRVMMHLVNVMKVDSKIDWRGARQYFGITLINLNGEGVWNKE